MPPDYFHICGVVVCWLFSFLVLLRLARGES